MQLKESRKTLKFARNRIDWTPKSILGSTLTVLNEMFDQSSNLKKLNVLKLVELIN